ncbi:glycosyltransferase family 39 protein [Anaerolineales bacterium HSG6]|nr:glycosyltransferase family 39 protein [Anaerolineales bacterium HSG6]
MQSPHHPNPRLILILSIYLFLAIAYSIVVPIGRGADEWAHYWYAQFIAEHGRLPNSPAEREVAGYKSDWPPLYHLITAGATAWIETDGPPTFKYRADNLRYQMVPSLGPEAILHTADERYPWQQEILVWHIGRFLSIGFGLGVLIVTYFIATEMASSHYPLSTIHYPLFTIHYSLSTILPLLAVSLLAFNPRFLFTSMLFSYDSLTLLLASLFFWLTLRIVNGYHEQWGFIGLGLLAGLALVTKYLTALLFVEILILAWLKRPVSSKVRSSLEVYSYSLTKLLQALLAFLLIISPWFAYLVVTFNEVETYGPVLGTLAPLIRGDGSDRTVEQIFASLSGGEAPPPVHVERIAYPLWQVAAELPTTFWGNPIIRPYPLNWFVMVMAILTMCAMLGLGLFMRGKAQHLRYPFGYIGQKQTSQETLKVGPASSEVRSSLEVSFTYLLFLILHCSLPLPFMLIRFFGARDVLESVQGRHILFLAAPAFSILMSWGLIHGVQSLLCQWSRYLPASSKLAGRLSASPSNLKAWTPFFPRFMASTLLAIMLMGALSQLIFMYHIYPPLLPIQTTPPDVSNLVELKDETGQPIHMVGGSELLGVQVKQEQEIIYVTFVWQGGDGYAPQDYQNRLKLVDEVGESWSVWLGYQTQALYPTRVWEAGDIIYDTVMLPLVGVPPGEYRILWRLDELTNFVELGQLIQYNTLGEASQHGIWQAGRVSDFVTVRERETVQYGCNLFFDANNARCDVQPLRLFGPNGGAYPVDFSGIGYSNFIVQPDWPSGVYTVEGSEVQFEVSESARNFEPPPISQSVEANFGNQLSLLGYDLSVRKWQAGDGLEVTLHWQALDWMGDDLVIFARLLDADQAVWGERDRLPRESYSTLLMAPNEIVIDPFAVPIQPDTPDGIYMLRVGLYREVDGQAESLLILDPNTGEPTEVSAINIGPIKVGGPPAGVTVTEPTYQHAIGTILGEQIQLLGYDSQHDCRSSEIACTLEYDFYWQAVQSPPADYTMFLHVRDAAGNVIAQKDQPPTAGVYPTGLWDTGEIIHDQLTLPLENLPLGDYEVLIGLYDFKTGQRLMVPESNDGIIRLEQFSITK